MCGLFGWTLEPSVTSGERVALAVMLASHMNERGEESWGAWTPDHGFVHKMVGSVTDDGYAMRLAAFDAVSVHTRYATHGDVSQENAHPFRAGSIIGAHNGCIWNAFALDRQYMARDFAVDSMHLIAHLASDMDTRELEGYGAVVWSDDADPGAFYLGRFCGGELAVAVAFNGDARQGLVWASTKEAVSTACRAAGLGWSFLKVKERVVYRIADGKMQKTPRRLQVRERTVTVSTSAPVSIGQRQEESEAEFALREEAAHERAIAWLREDTAVPARREWARRPAGFSPKALGDGFRLLQEGDDMWCDCCEAPLRMACEVREGACLECQDAAKDMGGAKQYAG